MIVKDETIAEIDTALKAGNFVGARKILEEISLKKVPARLKLRLAEVQVRAGFPKHAVEILYRSIHDKNDPPLPKALSIYALALQQMGAYNEALKIFEKLDFGTVPEANLYYAIGLFAKWEYGKAIPYLEKYISSKETTSYQKLVAKANLAQAHLYTGDEKSADRLISELLQATKENSYNLLYANSLDLKAQHRLFQKRYDEMNPILEEARSKVSLFPSHYGLIIDHWQAVSELGKHPNSKNILSQFKKIRDEAVKQQRWALVRESDFFQSIIDEDEDLFLKVYFGTPFVEYRKRLKKLFGGNIEIPSSYRWKGNERKVSEDRVIKVSEGTDLNTGASLKRGQVLHRLLQALSSDFYINFRTETLFSIIFSDEHFSPISSANRVHQSVNRLQNWFDENEITIKIRSLNEGYRIFFEKPYALEVLLEYEHERPVDIINEIQKALNAPGGLTAREIGYQLNIPVRTIYRKIEELLAGNKIFFERIGREVKYKVVGKS